jgi:hypothetical protein
VAALVGCAVVLPGCLISGHSATYLSGTEVSGAALGRVTPGESRKEFVLATFGEPSSKTTLEDGTELWKWQYTKTRSSRGTVLFLFSSSDYHQESSTTFVEFKGETVSRVWQEGGSKAQGSSYE